MHGDDLSRWTHDHAFHAGDIRAERSTWVVMWITAVAMVVEITSGWWFNSMALLADGWHMSSHAVAIGLSAMAYATARRFAGDARFAFGTWKVEILGGFASAIFLLGVAATMVIGSLERMLDAQPIRYREAIIVAILGLVVNIACALILGRAHHHGDDHHHGDRKDHASGGHQDLNLRSAYLHVTADAATSVLAIVALAGGWIYGWSWLDPMMGLVGAVLVAVWAKGLIVDTGRILLDREMDHPVVDEVRAAVESGANAGTTRLTDLHVWRVGKNGYACALTVVTDDRALNAERIRQQLAAHEEIVHSTIEVHYGAGATTAGKLAG